MYQSISQRFRRKNSNDLIVTFLPVVVVLTLHSYLRNADLNPTLFRVLQITAIVLLAALLAAVNHFLLPFVLLHADRRQRIPPARSAALPGRLTDVRTGAEQEITDL